MKNKVISEIGRSQIIGDSETAVAVDPSSHLKDARAVAIEGRQQRLLVSVPGASCCKAAAAMKNDVSID